MAASPESSAANLRTARRNVMGRLGITDTANLTFDLRKQYVAELAREILKYPQSFTADTVTRAQEIAAKDYGALAEDSFSFGEFADAAAAQAVITLPSVGNKLLVGVVIVAAVYFGVKALQAGAVKVPAA